MTDETTDTPEIPDGIAIDGAFYTTDDLEFAEIFELDALAREAMGVDTITIENPLTGARITQKVGLGDIPIDYIKPGLVFIVRRKSNPDYTYADALKLKRKDMDAMRDAALRALGIDPAPNLDGAADAPETQAEPEQADS